MRERERERERERRDEPPLYKTKIFLKDFYLQHKSPPTYSSHWLRGGRLTTECQTQKCLSHSEKAVNDSTFELQLTAPHHTALWGHRQSLAGGCNGVNILVNNPINNPIKIINKYILESPGVH